MSKIWPDDGEIHRYPKNTKHKCILGPLVRIKVIGANCPCQNPCVHEGFAFPMYREYVRSASKSDPFYQVRKRRHKLRNGALRGFLDPAAD